MHDLIIIGGGAAGLSATLYALEKQLDVVAICEEVGGKAGTQQHLQGQSGDEYLAGAEAIALLERRVIARDGVLLRDRAINVAKSNNIFQVETQQHQSLTSRAVLMATGATPLKLDVPGAKALLDHGIGYSISTHAHLLAGKRAAVIGTTPRALRGVAELARSAAQVYLVAPDASSMAMPLAGMVRRLPNVTIFEGYQLKAIAGTHNVEHMLIERDGEHARIPVEAVFADLGLLPNSGAVRHIVQLEAAGFIPVDGRNATTLPGLFAAGDVTTAFGEQILIAIGDGARAAASAYDYILVQPPIWDAEPSD
jgi:thioredoxin reductase